MRMEGFIMTPEIAEQLQTSLTVVRWLREELDKSGTRLDILVSSAKSPEYKHDDDYEAEYEEVMQEEKLLEELRRKVQFELKTFAELKAKLAK